ncbi:MAG: hypothetical protein JWQ04_3307 [Pedosphaera sp.]|nr:hypothetical protein [Pedosphaera sp.]
MHSPDWARHSFSSLVVIGGILLAAIFPNQGVLAANILNDPGFEATPGGVQTNLVVGWTTYGQNPDTYTEFNTNIARSGSNYFKVYQAFTGSVNYNGAYQDITANVGNAYTADGWMRSASMDKLAGGNVAWIEVSFRDASTAILGLYRSALITTNSIATGTFPLDTWVHLPVTNQYDPNLFVLTNTVTSLVAPAGTAFVRYQLMFQGDANYSGGSVYFDDQNLVQTLTNTPAATAWNIVWNDEFNGPTVDLTHWKFETGNGSGGWGNNELEYYTSRTQNVFTASGALHIKALKESYSGFSYTSTRMKTQDLFTKKYGRFEFRAKLPSGQGYWPAIWMMPQSSVYGGWAASGEIDVMENKGSDPANVLGTIHFGGGYPNNTQSFGNPYAFPNGDSVTNFHNYRLDWTTNSIGWYVDGQLYETQTSWWSSSNPTNTSIRNPYPAPFDQPFYLILNLAIGGNFGGNPNTSTVFPGEMQVDYIRVYDQTAPMQISLGRVGSNLVLSWPSQIVCHLQLQTNQTGMLTTNWIDLAGTASPYDVPLPATNRGVFYRLVSP